jgi:transcriptional regulator with XRE-family HTH domain
MTRVRQRGTKSAASGGPAKAGTGRRIKSDDTLTGQVRIGAKIRHARLVRELNLKELAEKVGCSVSALSKIEGHKANPSITMLHRICAALDCNLAALFSADEQIAVVAQAGERPVIKTDQLRRGRGVVLERLVPYSPGYLLQGNIHVIEPGGGSEHTLQHEGEELGYVVEGELELVVDGTTYLAKAGASFFFRSDLPHSYRNPGKEVTRVVWVNTPPTF